MGFGHCTRDPLCLFCFHGSPFAPKPTECQKKDPEVKQTSKNLIQEFNDYLRYVLITITIHI